MRQGNEWTVNVSWAPQVGEVSSCSKRMTGFWRDDSSGKPHGAETGKWLLGRAERGQFPSWRLGPRVSTRGAQEEMEVFTGLLQLRLKSLVAGLSAVIGPLFPGRQCRWGKGMLESLEWGGWNAGQPLSLSGGQDVEWRQRLVTSLVGGWKLEEENGTRKFWAANTEASFMSWVWVTFTLPLSPRRLWISCWRSWYCFQGETSYV